MWKQAYFTVMLQLLYIQQQKRESAGIFFWISYVKYRVPLFFNIYFPWLFYDQKMKIHDLSAQHIFPSKRYSTYKCIPESVVAGPSARSTIVKKINQFIHNLTL